MAKFDIENGVLKKARLNPGEHNIKIPAGVREIGPNAFYECGKRIVIDDDEIAYDRSGIWGVQLPEGLEVIGESAFEDFGFETIDIPDSVTRIDRYAFCGCDQLKAVKIPKGVKIIPSGVFAGCSKLEKADLPEGILSIGYEAFDFCLRMSFIKLPESLQEIGTGAFMWNISMSNITIPQNVRKIGPQAFGSCNRLTTIYIHSDSEALNEQNKWHDLWVKLEFLDKENEHGIH